MPKLARKWWTLIVVCTGIFMLLLDITIVNIALPQLVKTLHASFSDLEWVIDAYAIALAALLLIAGSMADLVGARRVFLTGLAVFCVSSLFCGLAQSPEFLIAFRAIQGIGGAAMFTTSLALLAHHFHGRERSIAFSAWGATAGSAVAIGPLLGGALTSGTSWRWIFLINVPIAIATFAATLRWVARAPGKPGVRPDWAGFVTLAAAIVAGVYGLIRGNADGWLSPQILTAFAVAVLLLVAFGQIEHRQRDGQPMLEPRLFRNPALIGACAGALVISASILSALLYLTLYFQDVLRYSPFATGLRFLPLTIPVIVVATISGRLVGRVPLRLLIGSGLGLVAVGLALMTAISPASDWTVLLTGMIIVGAGSGMTNPALAAAAVSTVSQERAGLGSGINNTFRQIGIALGIAGFGALFAAEAGTTFVHDLARQAPQLAGHADQIADRLMEVHGARSLHVTGPTTHAIALAIRSAYVAGLDRVFLATAIATACGAIIAAILMRPKHTTSETPAQAEPEETLRRAA